MQNDDLDELQDQERTRLKNKLPQDIKPCIAKMLGTPLAKGNSFSRSEVALIIAVEYKRLGKDKENALLRLIRWRIQQRPPLRPSEIRTAVNSAYKGKYDYGCNHPTVVHFCPYKDKTECPFYAKFMANLGVKGSKVRTRELNFWDYGWPQILKNSEAILYLAIKRIEKLQGVGAGKKIVANFNTFAKYSGVHKAHIGECFERLHEVGLIKYKKGLPYRFKVQATEVIRINPIPRPANNLKHRI